jgi:hypothetical protein
LAWAEFDSPVGPIFPPRSVHTTTLHQCHAGLADQRLTVCLDSPPLVSPHLTDDLGPLLSGSRPARFSVALVVPCLSSSPGWAGAHRKPRIPRGGGESVARATTAEFRAIFLNPSRPRILRIKSNASVFVPAAIRHSQASRSSPAMAKLLVLCTAPYCHYDFLISPHHAAVTLPLRFPLLAANREARSG